MKIPVKKSEDMTSERELLTKLPANKLRTGNLTSNKSRTGDARPIKDVNFYCQAIKNATKTGCFSSKNLFCYHQKDREVFSDHGLL